MHIGSFNTSTYALCARLSSACVIVSATVCFFFIMFDCTDCYQCNEKKIMQCIQVLQQANCNKQVRSRICNENIERGMGMHCNSLFSFSKKN